MDDGDQCTRHSTQTQVLRNPCDLGQPPPPLWAVDNGHSPPHKTYENFNEMRYIESPL